MVYHGGMATPPGRKALLFTAGGVPLSLPLGAVREIAPAGPGGAAGRARAEDLPPVSLAEALGLPGVAGRYALALEAPHARALLVDELRGIADLAQAEVFRLPERLVLPRPAPFESAFLFRGELYLEVSPAGVRVPAAVPSPPARASLPDSAPTERELYCERGGQPLAVPLSLLVQVIEPARVFPVPLSPQGQRGLLYHGRSLHPVFDAAALTGAGEAGDPRVLLLLDAGGGTAGVLVDRVFGVGEGEGERPIRRPAWDALLSPHGGDIKPEKD